MEFETLLYETANGVATLTLNRPEVLHALNAAMFNDLEIAFQHLREDDTVRVVLITGSGTRAFAAGADIRGLAETDSTTGQRLAARGQEVMRAIELCGKPVIACINGVALGGGCELALACSFRLASETAKLGQPEVKLGLVPGYGGTQRLTRLIGRGRALKMLLTGAPVDAAEALRLGLVEEVLPADKLMERAQEIAAMIVAVAPLAVHGVLEAVERGDAVTLDEGLRAEAEVFGRLCDTADKREGVTAFLEKRKAAWTGK